MPPTPRVVAHEVVNVAAIVESPSTVGMADSNIYFTDSLEQVIEHLDLIESLGVKNVRLLVPWIFVQPTDPMGAPVDWEADLDWAKLDQIVYEADRRGMGILGVLQWSPDWATDGPTGSGHPSDVQDFADFAAAVADRYRDKITAYEVWNEPNASFFWNPIDPVEYTRLLQATYTSLKSVSPDITVVGAVVSATLTWGDATMNAVDFVEAMYAAGADGFFDAISIHPYNFDTKFSEQDDLDWRELMPLFQIQKIRELMDQHQQPGEEQLKIWISEYGLPTSVVTPEKQLAFITDLLNAWQSFSGGGPIFMYTTKDDMNAIGDERFFGLFDEYGNFKGSPEALRDFQRLIDCLDGCSPGNPGNPSNPLGSLLELIQHVVTQVLSFVPNLVAGVVSAVTNLLGSILGGLSGASTATEPVGVGAGMRAMAAEQAGTDAVAEVDGPEALAAAPSLGGAVTEPLGDAVADELPVAGEETVGGVGVEPVTDSLSADPVVGEPVLEPVVEAPVQEAPEVDEPAVDVPVVDEPVVDVPAVDESVVEEPVIEVPVVEEPVIETPSLEPVLEPADDPSESTVTEETTPTRAESEQSEASIRVELTRPSSRSSTDDSFEDKTDRPTVGREPSRTEASAVEPGMRSSERPVGRENDGATGVTGDKGSNDHAEHNSGTSSPSVAD
ncbi:MAG: cellulase family glycosylhydrolase [Mycolicibacterium neoaurum]|uniref:cellulase family glycosylhydrolase n=1 Tax=Mycolicibacterium neoaurum TaxID=1795 RepID=UPI002FFC7D3B